MKTIDILFPVQAPRVRSKLTNRLHDFLSEEIVQGNLHILYEDFLNLEYSKEDFHYKEMFKCEGINFYIYEVSVTGEDEVIDSIKEWNDELKQILQ